MVYGTTKGDLAGDVVEGVKWAASKELEWGRERERERERRNVRNGKEEEDDVEMVLVGHSSGGGLTQYILGAGLLDDAHELGEGVKVSIKGVVLMGAVPGFGS